MIAFALALALAVSTVFPPAPRYSTPAEQPRLISPDPVPKPEK